MRALCAALLLLGTGASSPAAEHRSWDDPFPGVVQDSGNIKGFVGEFRWLSNFFPSPVRFDGLDYRSAEAAYQAAKFPAAERQAFTQLDPDAAKHLAHARAADTPAWNARKDAVMQAVLRAKFTQNPELRRRLCATEPKYLEETNWWNDRYWGVYQGQGENRLGRALMALRRALLQPGHP